MALCRSGAVFGILLLVLRHAACEDEDETCPAGSTDPACLKDKNTDEESAEYKEKSKLVEDGNALAGQGKYLEAAELYKKALAIDSTSVWAANPTVNFGLALKVLGLPKEGLAYMKRAVELNDKSFHTQYNYANELAGQNQFALADEHYGKAVDLPGANQFLVRLATARNMQKAYHFEEGREAFGSRDLNEEAYQVVEPLIETIMKEKDPDRRKVGMMSVVLTQNGKHEDVRKKFHQWTVKVGLWKEVNQRPINFDADFARDWAATPWWNPKKMDLPDFLDESAEQWKKFRTEFDKLLKGGKIKTVDHEDDIEYFDQSQDQDWRKLLIFNKGLKEKNNSKVAKVATKFFSESPVSGDGWGELSYYALMPGTRLTPRCGMTNVRLTCHLGLRIPTAAKEQVGITVADETRAWKQGAWSCFDDSFEHTMRNDADEVAGLLVAHFKHPADKKK